MIRKVAAVLVVFSCFHFGCGGGGGGAAPSGGGGGGGGATTPNISNAVVSPTSVYKEQGGGTVTVNLTMDFIDTGGDVASFTLDVYDSAGTNQLSTHTYPISGIGGITSGVINGQFVVADTTIGNFIYHIHVTDGAGIQSNTLTGTFSVTSNPSTVAISSYLAVAYAADNVSLASDIATVVAQAAANGSYGGGLMYTNLAHTKEAHVQSFLNSIVAYVTTLHNSYTLDKPAIVAMLATYNTLDIAWPGTLVLGGINSSTIVTMIGATTPNYNTTVNNAYTAAIASINAL
jgi:hypothetical protein